MLTMTQVAMVPRRNEALDLNPGVVEIAPILEDAAESPVDSLDADRPVIERTRLRRLPMNSS